MKIVLRTETASAALAQKNHIVAECVVIVCLL